MSEVFEWLDRASKSKIAEVAHAAEILKDYYQGVDRVEMERARSTEPWPFPTGVKNDQTTKT